MSGPPDEKWYRDGDPDQGYWRPSTVNEDRWIVVAGGMAFDPAQDAPGRPQPVQVDVAATPEPLALPLSRAQRIANAVRAVRSGDRGAVDLLRELLMGD